MQVPTNIIDFGMNVQEASNVARWRHASSGEPPGEASKGIGSVEKESASTSQ